MNKADLKRNLEAELLKIERQDKIYGVGETRYDLMIKDVLNYIDNSITKEVIEEKIEELKDIRKLKYDEWMNYKFESREQQDIDKKIEVLQELLDKR